MKEYDLIKKKRKKERPSELLLRRKIRFKRSNWYIITERTRKDGDLSSSSCSQKEHEVTGENLMDQLISELQK